MGGGPLWWCEEGDDQSGNTGVIDPCSSNSVPPLKTLLPPGAQHTHAGMMYVRRSDGARKFFKLARHANAHYWELGFHVFKYGGKALEIHWSYAFGKLRWKPLDFHDQELFAFNWKPGDSLPPSLLWGSLPKTDAEARLLADELVLPAQPPASSFHGYCHVHMVIWMPLTHCLLSVPCHRTRQLTCISVICTQFNNILHHGLAKEILRTQGRHAEDRLWIDSSCPRFAGYLHWRYTMPLLGIQSRAQLDHDSCRAQNLLMNRQGS